MINVPVSPLAVVVDCRDPPGQAGFWAHALAYKVSQRNPAEFQVSVPLAEWVPTVLESGPDSRSLWRRWCPADLL
jgi:hypothetical protein